MKGDLGVELIAIEVGGFLLLLPSRKTWIKNEKKKS